MSGLSMNQQWPSKMCLSQMLLYAHFFHGSKGSHTTPLRSVLTSPTAAPCHAAFRLSFSLPGGCRHAGHNAGGHSGALCVLHGASCGGLTDPPVCGHDHQHRHVQEAAGQGSQRRQHSRQVRASAAPPVKPLVHTCSGAGAGSLHWQLTSSVLASLWGTDFYPSLFPPLSCLVWVPRCAWQGGDDLPCGGRVPRHSGLLCRRTHAQIQGQTLSHLHPDGPHS